MKMAERQNIVAMGLEPEDVISFGGGWVNHPAPEEFRRAYQEIVARPGALPQERRLHRDARRLECREQIARFEAHLFGVPRLGAEHIAIGAGSTQLTHDLFRVLVDPGDTVMLLDPTYANYEGQLAFAVPGVNRPAARCWIRRRGHICQRPTRTASPRFIAPFEHKPRSCCSARPTTRPARSCRRRSSSDARAHADAGAWLAIDFAYKCQYFLAPPAYYAWSPADHPNVNRHSLQFEVGARSGTAAGLARGRRASRGRDRARAAVQSALPRHPVADGDGALSRAAIADGSLRAYVDDERAVSGGGAGHDRRDRRASGASATRTRRRALHCGRYRHRCGGVRPRALKATGVLVVPGRGFGPSLANGVRISYGPLVSSPDGSPRG